MGHGYVFSMAVGTIGWMIENGPFFVRVEQLILKGGGAGIFFQNKYPAVKHLKINILAWVPKKMNK